MVWLQHQKDVQDDMVRHNTDTSKIKDYKLKIILQNNVVSVV